MSEPSEVKEHRAGPERRTSIRYPLKQEVRHRALGDGNSSGSGETVNMSRRGVLFTTTGLLRRGDEIEVFIDWPERVNQRLGLRLVARGRVVRTAPGLAAMKILQHEFRTQALKPANS